MNEQRPPKKTEMIEVRVSYETKRDFLAACRTAGRSASDVIRDGMQSFIDRQAQSQEAPSEPGSVPLKDRLLKKRYLAVAVAATGVAGLAALPSAAAPDLAGMFARLDTDSDGVLSHDEFLMAQADTKTMKVRKLGQAGSANAEPMLVFIPGNAEDRILDGMQDVRFQSVGAASVETAEDVKRRSFAGFDADGDGRISLKEFQARQMTLIENGFRGLDKDGDGVVTAAEYSAIGQPVLLTPIGADPTFGASGKYGPIVAPNTLDADFARRDANKDGKLSLQEYLPPK